MRTDPAADVHADGGKFFFGNAAGGFNPNAGFAGDAIGRDTELGRSAHHGFFKSADVPVNVATDAVEIQNGIADDLTGTMIGDVAATIRFAEFDAFLAEDVLGGQEIFPVGAASEGDHVGMFAEKKDVIDAAGFARRHEAFLKREGSVPTVNSDIANEERLRHWKGCQISVN